MGTPTIKCLLIGNIGVGKSSLIIRFAEGKFPEYIPTGYEMTVSRTVNGTTVNLTVNEVPGDEDYDRLRPLSYPSMDVAVMCFAINDSPSFTRLIKVTEEVRHHCPNIPIMLLATKSDLITGEGNAESMLTEIASNMGIQKYTMCSALTGDGVEACFEEVILSYLNREIHVHGTGNLCCGCDIL